MSGCHLPYPTKDNGPCKCVYCLDKRIEKLEKLIYEINHWKSEIMGNISFVSEVKPNKCPLCNGEGNFEKHLPLTAKDYKCKLCNGKGIIWR